MKIVFSMILCIVSLNSLISQNFFSKFINFHVDTSETPFNMVSHDSDFYLISNVLKHGRYSSDFIKSDSNGNFEIKERFKKWAYRNYYGMAHIKKSLFAVFHEVDDNGLYKDSLVFYKYDVETASGSWIKKKSKFNENGIKTLFSFHDRLFFAIEPNSITDPQSSIFQFIELDTSFNEIDSFIIPTNGYSVSFRRMAKIDDHLYFIFKKDVTQIPDSAEGDHTTMIIKTTLDFKVLWSKDYDRMWALAFPKSHIFKLPNSNLVFNSFSSKIKVEHEVSPFIGTLYCIDTSGNLVWRRQFRNVTDAWFNHISPMENGDILASGVFGYVDDDRFAGWLVRMDQDGNVLWDRKFTDYKLASTVGPFNEFFHSQELPGGNIIAMGEIRHDSWIDSTSTWPDGLTTAGWFVKLDQNGCPGFDCEEYITNYTLSIKGNNGQPIKPITVYPNPGTDICYLKLENMPWTHIEVTDVLGRHLKRIINLQELTTEVNTEDLISGIYFLSVFDKNQLIGVAKWVRL